ncbi:MAG: hypothetical protein ACKO9B_13290 [Planctomycetota bacterium]
MPVLPSPPSPPARFALWLGAIAGVELELAHAWLETILPVVDAPGPEQWFRTGAGQRHPPALPRPWVALAALPRPGLWSVADVTAVAASLPLVPLVAVTTSLAEGSRRSGDSLAGIEEVPWVELPGRVWGWASGAARPAGWLPATSRRDERWLVAPKRPATARRPVAVAAPGTSREQLCDLLDAAGFAPQPLDTPRPHPGCPGPVIWDAGGVGEECCSWLRLLTADGRRDVVVLESFPRGDGVRLALEAGAAAVLPRVVAAETVAGTLGWITARGAAPG